MTRKLITTLLSISLLYTQINPIQSQTVTLQNITSALTGVLSIIGM